MKLARAGEIAVDFLARSALVFLVAGPWVTGPTIVQAQDAFPSRPIRLIVPFPPGGSGDTVARMLVPRWSEILKQQIVVDNRGGGGSNIGIDLVAPGKTPHATIRTLHDSLATVVASAEIADRLGGLAFEVIGADPDRSAAILKDELTLWARVVKSTGAKAE